MRSYGRAAVSEFLEDRIVYRNLAPADKRLPPLDGLREALGLPAGRVPRKSEADYARVIIHQLAAARYLDAPEMSISRLIFIGDTRLNDSTAFANLCQAGGWQGIAFIGAESQAPASVNITATEGGYPLYLANRWAMLPDFAAYCAAHGYHVDVRTAVVVDLDKTALGARGRNAHAIDQARVQAVRATVAGMLGESFDHAAFQQAYDRLNQPAYHPFTADNQDYLAYICLILGSGLYELDELVAEVDRGSLVSFQQFIGDVEGRVGELPSGLADLHAGIYRLVRLGDPTPFKAFRRREYLATVGRMGCLPDDAPVEQMLAEEIVLTQEVREICLSWLGQGALLFGLSDKPDEASLPTPELAAQGYQPIHRTVTHAVGR